MTKRDVTPLNGSQIDPSVAISATTGKRLVAATDVAVGPDTVHVWNRAVGGDVPVGTLVAGGLAHQPAIAWDGSDAHPAVLATASTAGCPTVDGIKVRSYDPVTKGVGAPTTLAAPVDGGGAQTWPRVVLGADGDLLHAGKPIVVADQENCTTGDHRIVVAWDSPSHTIGQITDGIDEAPAHRTPLYPDVAVLGADTTISTRIMIAYLGELTGTSPEEQDVRVRQCVVHDLTVDCSATPVIVAEKITPPGTVSKAGTSIDALAAPSIACDPTACSVVWTAATGSGRSRVFRSRATSASNYSWSSPTPVASSGTAGSQLLPSVAVAGSRTDVVYVNLYDDGTVDTFQTSFDGSARGRDTSLIDGNPYVPAPVSIGQRTDATELAGAGTSPVLAGYFPDGNGGLGTVSEAELAHGTTPPALQFPGAPQTLGKNTSVNLSSWLTYTDPDGDPVTVTVDDPAHGSIVSGIYTAEPTYAGADAVSVHATDGVFTPTFPDHAMTITNQQPVFDAPAPAIVDEGGATVTVPLHAVDPDDNDTVVYSVVVSGSNPLLTAPGRATIVNAALQLTIPAGVRAMGPLQIKLRARDTTTGAQPLYDDQDLSVTIRPDLATPIVLPMSDFNITGARAAMTADVQWDDPSSGCLHTSPLGCHVRRVWNFGDGTPSVTTTDLPTITHDYPRAGVYSGQVTSWVLWGSAQVASPPRSFNVTVHDDGRALVWMTPSSRRVTPTARQVQVAVTARATGTAWITITYATRTGPKSVSKPITLKAGVTITKLFPRISLKTLTSRRATIKISGWGMLASTVPPTDVYRTVILR